jgi:hypothetical protein
VGVNHHLDCERTFAKPSLGGTRSAKRLESDNQNAHPCTIQSSLLQKNAFPVSGAVQSMQGESDGTDAATHPMLEFDCVIVMVNAH